MEEDESGDGDVMRLLGFGCEVMMLSAARWKRSFGSQKESCMRIRLYMNLCGVSMKMVYEMYKSARSGPLLRNQATASQRFLL